MALARAALRGRAARRWSPPTSAHAGGGRSSSRRASEETDLPARPRGAALPRPGRQPPGRVRADPGRGRPGPLRGPGRARDLPGGRAEPARRLRRPHLARYYRWEVRMTPGRARDGRRALRRRGHGARRRRRGGSGSPAASSSSRSSGTRRRAACCAGLRVRWGLGLRENLFVIDRERDAVGRGARASSSPARAGATASGCARWAASAWRRRARPTTGSSSTTTPGITPRSKRIDAPRFDRLERPSRKLCCLRHPMAATLPKQLRAVRRSRAA